MQGIVFIDTDTQTARAGLTGALPPAIRGKLFSPLVIIAAFVTAGEVVALEDATGRCVLKKLTDPTGSALLLDTTWAVSGADEETRYTFTWDSADSSLLRTALGKNFESDLILEVQWTIAGVNKAAAFPITFENAWNRPDDAAPDPAAEASEEWLSERAVRFDEAQDLTDEQIARVLLSLGMVHANGKLTFTNGDYIRLSRPAA